MIIKVMVKLQQLNSGHAFETEVNSHEINENIFSLTDTENVTDEKI